MDYFTRWAEHEFGLTPRITATLLAGIVFVILLPGLIIEGTLAFNKWLNVPGTGGSVVNHVLGAGVGILGWLLAIWSIITQLTYGRGTPLPMMATQRLLTTGPFAYCRNPMSLGTIIFYSGIAIWLGSFCAAGMVLILSMLLILYLKFIEEKELEARFGQAYLDYKRSTSFLLPNFRKKRFGERDHKS